MPNRPVGVLVMSYGTPEVMDKWKLITRISAGDIRLRRSSCGTDAPLRGDRRRCFPAPGQYGPPGRRAAGGAGRAVPRRDDTSVIRASGTPRRLSRTAWTRWPRTASRKASGSCWRRIIR